MAKGSTGISNLPLKSPICTFFFAYSICNSVSQRENAHLGDFSGQLNLGDLIIK